MFKIASKINFLIIDYIFMSTFANQLKSEIARIAKKEIKQETPSLKKSSAQYRSDIAALKRRVAALESMVAKLSKHSDHPVKAQVSEDSAPIRFRADGFVSLRKKLAITAQEMGTLVGVTAQSILKWEHGKSKPRASQLQAIAQVRKMGKRDVLKRLEVSQ